ncbi:unnamed protein product [Cuscuta epithymum]|uniref:Uncharacterized protein n=1 Tax=Cuscuta epithymum TaxID=186058 RepID=A0AAV0EZS6_9ASTE|nr:unnamed protein product [Cuscuta epithymum]
MSLAHVSFWSSHSSMADHFKVFALGFLLGWGQRLIMHLWRSRKPKSPIEAELSALSEEFGRDLRELAKKYRGLEDRNYGRELVELYTEYTRKVVPLERALFGQDER